MPRAKLLKNGVLGAVHISGVVVVCIFICWSRPAHSAEPSVAPDEEPHLQLAPIRLLYTVGGNIGYVFQRNAIGSSKTMQQTLGEGVSAGVRISSFIWQPWLAQVNSQLTANANHSSTYSSSSPEQSLVRTNFEGDLALDILKFSRYPFQARVYKDDNRYRAFYSGTNLVVQTTGYSLTQAYNTMNRRLVTDAGFSSSKSGGPNRDESFNDQLRFKVQLQPARFNSINISGDETKQDVPAQGRRSVQDTLVTNHAFRPNDSFAVANMANIYKYHSTQGANTAQPQQMVLNSRQFSSIASIRPETTPLTLTGSVRLLSTDTAKNGISAPALKNSNFNLGANYLFSKLIRMYGSVNVADYLGTQEVITNAALTAARPYSMATTTLLDDYRYSGSIGGSISTSNKTTTNSNNQTTTQNTLGLGVYLSHALDKTSEFGSGNLSKHLTQTVSTSFDGSGSSSPVKLDSGGALTWNRAKNKETTMLRLSANDSRNLNGLHSAFQMINLQASRGEALSSHETLHGNLTVQATRRESGGLQSPSTITPSAELVYRQERLFKVRHLTFDSSLRIADSNIAPGSPDQETRSWENDFTYKIGRLNTLLKTQLAKFGNQVATSIYFTVNRTF